MTDFLPVILFLSIVLTTFNRGFFSPAALVLLIIIYIYFLVLYFKKTSSLPKKPKVVADSDAVYRYLLIITYTLFIFFSGGIYQEKLFESLLLALLPFVALPLVLTFYLSDSALSKISRNRRFYFLLIIAFIVRVLMVRSSPAPIIDVYTMLKEAPQAVLQG